MPRVRWSATLERQEDEGSSSLSGTTTNKQLVRKSNLKPPSMGRPPRRKSKASPPRRGMEEGQQEKHQNREQASSSSSSKDAEAWRERGKLYRAKIMMKDEESGGDAFTLSNECEIEKYYNVADRVLEQFLNTTVEDKAKLTEAYLVGNRLVKFVSRVLPTHKDYFSNDPKREALRCQSQSQLVQLLQYLEELALIIDEGEYQEFIRENQQLLRPTLSGEEADDDSSTVSSLDADEPQNMTTAANHHQATTSFPAAATTSTYDGSLHQGVNKYQEIQQAAFDKAKTQKAATSAAAQQHSSSSQSRIRQLQDLESKSWDDAFSDQIAPNIPELEPSSTNKKTDGVGLFPETATSDLEWSKFPSSDFYQGGTTERKRVDTTTASSSSCFPGDFPGTVDFTSSGSNVWSSSSSEQYSSYVWTRQGQEHSSLSSTLSGKHQYEHHSHKPQEKMTLRPKAIFGNQQTENREHSPKSVFELPEFMPEKKAAVADDSDSNTPPTVITSGSVEGYLQRIDLDAHEDERPPPSDDGDGMSALSGEEEEASLTGAPTRRRSSRVGGHFKGCVRCLLD